MSGSRASQEHEQRPCVDVVDRSGHLYWMIRIPASQHLRRMGATATSVSCVESCLESALSHTLRLGSTPSSWYGTQQRPKKKRAPKAKRAASGVFQIGVPLLRKSRRCRFVRRRRNRGTKKRDALGAVYQRRLTIPNGR
jgi:hypothetical protein